MKTARQGQIHSYIFDLTMKKVIGAKKQKFHISETIYEKTTQEQQCGLLN